MSRGLLETLSLTRDPAIKEIIRSLWREYYGLYDEKYEANGELDENELPVDPEKVWLRNVISENIKFGQAIGQDHQIEGNRSIAIGQGGVTKSLMELVLGSYAEIPEGQDPEQWVASDLLLVLGNGQDEDSRSNAIELLKNGITRFLNAIRIGKWEPKQEGILPSNGTLQWTLVGGLQVWNTDKWESFLTEAPEDSKPYGRQDKEWVEVAALDHDHEIGNQVLLFENGLI